MIRLVSIIHADCGMFVVCVGRVCQASQGKVYLRVLLNIHFESSVYNA